MTVKGAIRRVLEIAREQLGYHETGINWNKYAAELAVYQNLFWGGSKQNKAWCGVFIVWLFYIAFRLELAVQMLCADVMPNGMAGCSFGAQYFRDAGRWYTKPEPGDIIFFGPAGKEEHQGIVEDVSGNTVTTIEGNSSDSVCRRQYSVWDSRITGYGRPRWELAADGSEEDPAEDEPEQEPETEQELEPEERFAVMLHTVRPGQTGKAVRVIQAALISEGHYCGGKIVRGDEAPDGEFGPSTENAVKLFQMKHSLTKTGAVDEATMKALLEE